MSKGITMIELKMTSNGTYRKILIHKPRKTLVREFHNKIYTNV